MQNRACIRTHATPEGDNKAGGGPLSEAFSTIQAGVWCLPRPHTRINEGPLPSRTTDWRRAVVVTRHGAATYIGPSFTCNIFVGGCSNRFQLLAEPMKVIYPTCDLEVNAYEHRVHTRMTIRFLAIIKPVSPLRHRRYRERHGHSNRTDRQVRGGPTRVRPSPGGACVTGRGRDRLLRPRAARAPPPGACGCTPPADC